MLQFLKDMRNDILTVVGEIVVVIVKVAFIYGLITHTTDLAHDQALETAILVGAVDFLSGTHSRFRTVTDVKEKITMSEKGKRITQTISRHTTTKD